MKRAVAMGLALAMVASLTACGGGNSDAGTAASSAVDSGTSSGAESGEDTGSTGDASEETAAGTGGSAAEVTIISGDPASFMPLNQTGGGKNALSEVYEALVDMDGFGGEIYGNLAKEWWWDGADLHVEIYDYIYDSQGNHITADDVVFSYKESCDQGYTKSNFTIYCDSNAEALSDTEVVFHFLPDQTDVFLAEFTLLSGQYIFSEEAYKASEDGMSTTPVGTGPYVVTEFVPGAYCTLEKNADYWQTDASLVGPQHVANVDKMTYKFITDESQQVTALLTNEADFLDGISAEAKTQFDNAEGWGISESYSHNCLGLTPNCLEGLPLSDMNLRAAIFWAVDVEDIIAAAGGSEFARRVSCWGVPDTDLYNAEWDTWDNYETKSSADMEKAQEFMSKANYNGEKLRIIYNVDGGYANFIEPMALMVGAACDSLGINYELENLADDVFATTWQSENSSDWDIMIWSQGCDGDLLKFYRNNFNTEVYKGGAGHYYDETLDQLVKNANSASGATQENMDALIKHVVDNYYAYGFLEPVAFSAYNTDIIETPEPRTYRAWVIPGSWTYK